MTAVPSQYLQSALLEPVTFTLLMVTPVIGSPESPSPRKRRERSVWLTRYPR